MSDNLSKHIYIRLTAVGTLITVALGMIQCINASLSGDYIGAGILVVARDNARASRFQSVSNVW